MLTLHNHLEAALRSPFAHMWRFHNTAQKLRFEEVRLELHPEVPGERRHHLQTCTQKARPKAKGQVSALAKLSQDILLARSAWPRQRRGLSTLYMGNVWKRHFQ